MPKTHEGLVRLIRREGVSLRIVDAFAETSRAGFVPADSVAEAFQDRPIALPSAQTTSQPSLIARMLDVLELEGDERVLEIGSGFGYQTALLCRLAREVFAIERMPDLAEATESNLKRANLTGVHIRIGDGWNGWPEAAPFDAIVVSASASDLPPALAGQLREGGRLVIPLRVGHGDEVVLFQKGAESLDRIRLVTPARFVPLVPGSPEPND